MRRLESLLRFGDTRVQISQIGFACLGALWRIQILGVRGARGRQESADLACLLQHVEQRQLLRSEVGRSRMLNAQACLLREAAAAEASLI